MYSETVKPEVHEVFRKIGEKVSDIVMDSQTVKAATDNAARVISSELSSWSGDILSDMLSLLSKELMKTEFFVSDVDRRNQFNRKNLTHEILSKYEFEPEEGIDYTDVSKLMKALKAGGISLASGAAVEIGVVLIKKLPLSSLAPVPVSVLLAVSVLTTVAAYFAAKLEENSEKGRKRSKRELIGAFDEYLSQTEKQFLSWLDEVEKYFNMRVEEIKKTI